MLLEVTADDVAWALLKDDPVRPTVSKFGPNKHVYALYDLAGETVKAILCISLNPTVCKTENDLDIYADNPEHNEVCTFYTIWSYAPRAGVELALTALAQLPKIFPFIKRVVTLSPKTEMARNFHLRNGAKVLQINESTVNFEYALDLTWHDNNSILENTMQSL